MRSGTYLGAGICRHGAPNGEELRASSSSAARAPYVCVRPVTHQVKHVGLEQSCLLRPKSPDLKVT